MYHCAKHGHTKDTCWKIHDKPTEWKSSKSNFDRDGRANSAKGVATTKSNPFIKEQLKVLQKLLNSKLSQHATPNSSISMQARACNSCTTFSVWIKRSKHWIIDSRVLDHIMGDNSLFHDYRSNNHVSLILLRALPFSIQGAWDRIYSTVTQNFSQIRTSYL